MSGEVLGEDLKGIRVDADADQVGLILSILHER